MSAAAQRQPAANAPRSSINRRPVILAVVGLVISAIGLWLVVQGIDPAKTAAALAHVNMAPFGVAAIAIVVQLFLRSTRWAVLLERDGRRPLAGRLAPVLCVGYLANTVLPARLGEPVRAVLAARREGIAVPWSLGSVALERAIDTLTLGLLAVPALFFVSAPDWLLRTALIAAALAATAIALLQTRIPRLVVERVKRMVGARPAVQRWLDHGLSLAASLNVTGRPRAFGIALLLSCGAWLLDAVVYWSAASAIGISISPAAAMLISAITVLGTAVPSAPGYLGVYELVASTMAQALGVPADQALAFAIVAHALSVLPLAVVGLFSVAAIGAPQLRSALRSAEHPLDTEFGSAAATDLR